MNRYNNPIVQFKITLPKNKRSNCLIVTKMTDGPEVRGIRTKKEENLHHLIVTQAQSLDKKVFLSRKQKKLDLVTMRQLFNKLPSSPLCKTP